MLGDMGPMIMMTFLYKFGGDLVETCMNHPNTIKFIESKPKFDICIVENFNADGFFVSRFVILTRFDYFYSNFFIRELLITSTAYS